MRVGASTFAQVRLTRERGVIFASLLAVEHQVLVVGQQQELVAAVQPQAVRWASKAQAPGLQLLAS